jgi:DNA modification methylase
VVDDRRPAQWRIECGDALEVLRRLPDHRYQACITSPPYFGLRDYGHDEQIGLEETPKAYIARLVEVFAEVRRVLRDNGLLWVVVGDSYADSWGNGAGYKPKDLLMIPAQLALALRADGWYLRSDIAWAKPNPIPGSQRDRCTSSWEHVFMLAKSKIYHYDDVAVQEPAVGQNAHDLTGTGYSAPGRTSSNGNRHTAPGNGKMRTKRDVWTVATVPFPDAHWAVFPPKLVEPMALASSSPKCCDECGAPYKRVVERKPMVWREGPTRDQALENYPDGSANGRTSLRGTMVEAPTTTTTGFAPTCKCVGAGSGRCAIIDPFAGAGTTGLIALRHGCDFLGIELNPKYAEMARARIAKTAPINSAPDREGALLAPYRTTSAASSRGVRRQARRRSSQAPTG